MSGHLRAVTREQLAQGITVGIIGQANSIGLSWNEAQVVAAEIGGRIFGSLRDPEPGYEALLGATDGLAHLLGDVLRKYGGTMKSRGDHDLFDALVRYRSALNAALAPSDAQP